MEIEAVDGSDVSVGRSGRARPRRWSIIVGVVGALAIACSAVAVVRGTTEDRLVESVLVTGADRDAGGDWVRPDGTPVLAYRLEDGAVLEVIPPDGFDAVDSVLEEQGYPGSYLGPWEGQQCRIGVILVRDGEGTSRMTWDPATEQRVFVEAGCPGWPVISV